VYDLPDFFIFDPINFQEYCSLTIDNLTTPLFTIITVSFNAQGVIEKTIKSVITQNYDGFEYLIIDGGSEDGTVDVVSQYKNYISYFSSEKDGGIYYGMNKGIGKANGDYVLFLNAGDVFSDEEVLADVASFICNHPEADVVYGNSKQILEYGDYVVKPKEAYINNKMSISHQASFVKRGLLLSHLFDTRYRYAADFEQLSYFYLSGAKFCYIDRVISNVEMTDGATYRHYLESANEMYDIIEKRGIDVSKERKLQIRRKKITRLIRNIIPSPIRNPLFRVMAKYYKVL